MWVGARDSKWDCVINARDHQWRPCDHLWCLLTAQRCMLQEDGAVLTQGVS